MLFLLCAVGTVCAEEETVTADKVAVSEAVELVRGGNQNFFTVKLEGSATYYTAYQMNIYLPNGMEFVGVVMANKGNSLDGNDIYPYETETDLMGNQEKNYTHTLSYADTLQADGTLKVTVVCYSTKNEALTATSGALFHVLVKASDSPYIKPGVNNVELKKVIFSTLDATRYDFADTSVEAINVSGECSVTLNITANNQIGTCVLPFEAELPAGLEAYSCNCYTSDALYLTPVTRMEAYTPYIVYAPSGYNSTFTGTPNEADYNARVENGEAKDGYLTGALKQTELVADANGNENYYVLQRKESADAPMFYHVGSSSYILPAGKCYLTLPTTATVAATLRLGSVNGMLVIEADKPQDTDAPLYDLQGRQVLRPVPGQIYIQNGKKIIHQTN